MRWATYRHTNEQQNRVGLVEGERVFGLPPGETLLGLLQADGLEAAARRAKAGPAEEVALSDVRLRSPIPLPPTVRDFYAFDQHVRTFRKSRGQEMESVWYQIPTFYFTNPYAINGPGDDIAVPLGCVELDYELEVAAVVGRGGSDLTPGEAEACIAGYTIMNDWSARDLQREEMKLMLGPGDVIGTGTCGNGCIAELSLTHGSDRYPWLKPGDEVELAVEGLGSITNRVVPGPPFKPLR